MISPKSSSCVVCTLLLLDSSSNPLNAVTTSCLLCVFIENSLLNTNLFCFINTLNISFTFPYDSHAGVDDAVANLCFACGIAVGSAIDALCLDGKGVAGVGF